jgi:hypothetical protein
MKRSRKDEFATETPGVDEDERVRGPPFDRHGADSIRTDELLDRTCKIVVTSGRYDFSPYFISQEEGGASW